MSRETFDAWRDADRKAHAAEQESKLLTKKVGRAPIPDARAEKRAKDLRDEANRQFDAAMQEMHGLVDAALRKPVRKPSE